LNYTLNKGLIVLGTNNLDDKLTKEIWGDMEYDPPGFLFWVV
jgi:hypothetical protein